MTGEWHPWRALRSLVDWTLRWGHLPDGVLGETDWEARTVTLRHGLTQAERRSTLTHELEHVARGPVPVYCQAREERAVDEAAARRLIRFDRLVDAMVWSLDEYELAELLWVDVPTVVTRLATLTVEESSVLVDRLDAAELLNP